MNASRPQTWLVARRGVQTLAKRCVLGLVAALFACNLMAQTASEPAASGSDATATQKTNSGQSVQQSQTAPEIPDQPKEMKHVRGRDKERAAKLYLDSSKLFVNRQFEEARKGFEQAAALDPSNSDFRLAADVARSHEVTALIQEGAKDRLLGNEAGARDVLTRARAIDPSNFEVSQHLDELGDDAARAQPKSLYGQTGLKIANAEPLLPLPAPHSFHARTDQRQLVQQVFKAYGVIAMIDDSVRAIQVRLDADNASFEEATRILGLVTHTFFVPLDAHHVIVADDTIDNRRRLTPEEIETVYLGGMSDADLNEVQSLAKNVFQVQQANLSTSQHSITLRAPGLTLDAFNSTMQDLMDGRSQVVLDVKLIQVAHATSRNTGTQFPQSISAFNVFAEEQSILNANQSLVQQIISSGLASPNDPLAILGILIASGQVSSPLLSSGFALFGGGLTESALAPGTTTFNLSLNTSDSRELDDVQLRLEDGEEGTFKEGEKYPIQTSSYSSLSPNIPGLAGLTGAGTSSSLTSLLSSLGSSVPNIPMVQYQDLGLTLKATPKVLRNGAVALSINMTLDALSGQTIDGNPVLNNRAYTGVVTLKEGSAAVVATEVDKSQSLIVSGTPGLSEIPGMNNVTSKDLESDYATLVIVMTPHVVRGPQAAGHTAMMRVESAVR
jgi:Flp pilus assembly secretin CpaC